MVFVVFLVAVAFAVAVLTLLLLLLLLLNAFMDKGLLLVPCVVVVEM